MGCKDDSAVDPDAYSVNPDVNGDGTLDILVIGTSKSIKDDAEEFSPNQIATELQRVLSSDASVAVNVNVVAEDIYQSKEITIGLGQAGTEVDYIHYSHSLVQYYYWPEGRDARMSNLTGTAGTDWDYIIIGADPYITSTIPGYYSLGVNKIAAKVVEGGALPLLLMMWPKSESSNVSINHFEEFTYRTSDGAKVHLPVVPAGLSWENLPASMKDVANVHPTPNGAYLTAAAIYAHIFGKSASSSEYVYDDDLAEVALSTMIDEMNQVHYTGELVFASPFKNCEIIDEVLNYNHTGTSSENGILNGLSWVMNMTQLNLQADGAPPINFNYGRANTNFEPNKRYQIDPSRFDYSLGFPMQDNGNHGDVSMLYGLDKRLNESNNGTDLGVALYMVRESELPYGRAIPVRTLFAQMREVIPDQSAYGDSWHMHDNLNKAIGAYMFTLLTGKCVLGDEPTNIDSSEWRTWLAHKTGYETAWNLMHLKGNAPVCN
ncbi:MAG: hypothetical protein GY751_20100 [Bacteroidetes bacterium]|nr:hypothetical protein [Bacteroidota bacterium]